MTRRSTKEQFIEKSIAKHGDKYSYDKVIYVNNRTKVIIHCKKCQKDFEQTPDSHTRGKACKECSIESRGKKRRSTKDEFIIKARTIHLDHYDYSEVVYIKNDKKVHIKCNRCGKVFSQRPMNHLRGDGCPLCRYEKLSELLLKTNIQFIKDAENIHGDKYSYSETKYIGVFKSVSIYCNRCEKSFNQIAHDHLSGKGCQDCGNRNRGISNSKSLDGFLFDAKVIHKGIYDYSEVEYKRSHILVRIKCTRCDQIFMQKPDKHLQGHGCEACGRKDRDNALRKTMNQFMKEALIIHENNYTYDQSEYINLKTFIKIFCVKCNLTFEQRPSSHLAGHGCPYHMYKTQARVFKHIQTLYPGSLYEYRFPNLPNRRFDIFIPEVQVVVEIDGRQHFEQIKNWGNPEDTHRIDRDKMDFLLCNGITVIRLYQPDVYKDSIDWKGFINDTIKHKARGLYTLSTKNVYNIFNDYIIPAEIVFIED